MIPNIKQVCRSKITLRDEVGRKLSVARLLAVKLERRMSYGLMFVRIIFLVLTFHHDINLLLVVQVQLAHKQWF